MKVVCAYCEREGRPSVIAEKDPIDDPTLTHGICPEHLRQLREEIAAWHASRKPAPTIPDPPAV
ncbi:MAG: hypothetical protein HY712_06985 [candidate division NC10 bacterium]|nr:hypothetical protein [candidate division NC10 bacterium]